MNGKSRKTTILEGLKTIGFAVLLAVSMTFGITTMSWITTAVNETGNYWYLAFVPVVLFAMTLPLTLVDEEGA